MSTRIMLRLERAQAASEKALRGLIGGLVLDNQALTDRVAVLEHKGDPGSAVQGKPQKQAKVPARPEIMVASNVGKDPKTKG